MKHDVFEMLRDGSGGWIQAFVSRLETCLTAMGCLFVRKRDTWGKGVVRCGFQMGGCVVTYWAGVFGLENNGETRCVERW
jgi:hypothetical protein